MKELIRTNDFILINRIQNMLDDVDIQYKLLDSHASIIQGSIDAIQKRILVFNNDFIQSQKLIKGLSNIEESE